MDLTGAVWRKSSFSSGNGGACVEVAVVPGAAESGGSVEAVRRAVDQAAAALGGLDVLVNNAGVYFRHEIAKVSYQEWQVAWRDIIGVNLTGAANATWCAVQHMIAGGGGRIINISSRGAFRGEPRHPAYGASKAGLNALGQSLAASLAPYGIAVATVAPGYV